MELIVVRHSLAEDREIFERKSLADQFRPLVEKGRRRTEKLALKLKSAVDPIDLIVTSPFLRARETAEILQKFWGGKLVEAAELVPQSPPESFFRWLIAHSRNCRRVVVVGHEPQLSNFISYLLTGDGENKFIEMKKTGACCLKFESFQELEPGKVQLAWLLTPKISLD